VPEVATETARTGFDGVELTRGDKELWPELGVTKRDYLEYLDAVADRMLPWLRERPLTLVRAPDGVGKHRYYQKDAPSYAPTWIRTVTMAAESAGRDVRYIVCRDRRTLLWLGNQAAIEFHPALIRTSRLERPDVLVFDIDPPSGAFGQAAEVAKAVRVVLDAHGLPHGLKTSGAKGLHVFVPLERRHTAEQVRRAGFALAAEVVDKMPELATIEFRKRARAGRVFLDVTRNGGGQTVIAAYSPRVRPEGTVSFPITWTELGDVVPEHFTLRTAPELLRGAGPRRWKELERVRARLPATLTR
jgi:bifunctional non-homologous end joining protein LigD